MAKTKTKNKKQIIRDEKNKQINNKCFLPL